MYTIAKRSRRGPDGAAALKCASLVAVAALTFLTVGPLAWLGYSSFKPHAEIVRNVFSLPAEPTLDNFARAWRLAKLGVALRNSLLYSTVPTAAAVFLSLSMGFAIAKLGSRLAKPLVAFLTLGLLVTTQSVLVPVFVLEVAVGIDDTILGVLLPYVAFGLPFLTFLALSYIKGIPNAYLEAARIDGATVMATFLRVVLPMSRPVAATMLIFSFFTNWNEFSLVYILTSDAGLRSLPVAINAFASGRSRDYGLQLASLVLAVLPMLAFYAAFRKQIARGFAAEGLKE